MSETPADHHFDYLRCRSTIESGGVERYHAVPSVLVKQRVDSHAWSVALLCQYLTMGTASRDLILHALLHDSAELFTGDIPFTVKRDNPEVKRLTDDMASRAYQRYLFPLPDLPPCDMAVLKVADTLDGWRWCQMHEPRGPVADRWFAAWRQAREKFLFLGADFWVRAEVMFREYSWVEARP